MSGTKMQRTTGTPNRYIPFGSTIAREVNDIRDRVRRMIEEPFGRMSPADFAGDLTQAVGWMPAAEVSESEAEYTVAVELPGMKAKDVQVDFSDGVLTLRGERQEEREENDRERRYHVWERNYGSFLRTFQFPAAIDEEKIRAAQRDGVLEVHLPKKAGAAAQGRRIEVTETA